MERLNDEDWSLLSDQLQSIYAESELEQLPERITKAILELVPSDRIAYSTIDFDTNTVTPLMDPIDPLLIELSPIYTEETSKTAVWQEFKRTGETFAGIPELFPNAREYKLSRLYNEFYRPLKTPHAIGFSLFKRGDGAEGAIALFRGRHDYNARDRTLLQLVRRHARQAFLNLRAFEQVREEALLLKNTFTLNRQGLLILKPSGTPDWISPLARKWLIEYFPDWRDKGALPEVIRKWLRAMHQPANESLAIQQLRKPLIITKGVKTLEIRAILSENEPGRLLLTEEAASGFTPADLKSLRLTSREAEVMYWVVQGKTNPEIAIILQISTATANKHMERILAKLDAPNRTSAAAIVNEFIRLRKLMEEIS